MAANAFSNNCRHFPLVCAKTNTCFHNMSKSNKISLSVVFEVRWHKRSGSDCFFDRLVFGRHTQQMEVQYTLKIYVSVIYLRNQTPRAVFTCMV